MKNYPCSPTLVTLLAVGLLCVACAPVAQPPTPVGPPKPAVSKVEGPEATQPPPKPAEARPAASPSAPAAAKPAEAWDQVLVAARREGKVVVLGPQATQTRDALTQTFQSKYPDISLDYNGMASPQIPAKLLTEQAAGLYSTDVVIHGTTTFLTGLKSADALEAIRPLLVGPASQDESRWRGGKFSFADTAARYNLVFSTYVKAPFFFNKTLAAASDFKSYKDLLDPKWKGKMAMLDPRQAGGGSSVVTYWYATEGLGTGYIRQFFAQQDVLLLRDDRQILDLVARGQYPIGIGAGDAQTTDLIRKGLPIERVPAESLQEVPYVTAGTGSVAVILRPPHPNAAKVYLDHLLSKEVQHEWSQAVGFASLRLDVPRDHVQDFFVPKDGVKYLEQHTEPNVMIKDEIDDLLKDALPS